MMLTHQKDDQTFKLPVEKKVETDCCGKLETVTSVVLCPGISCIFLICSNCLHVCGSPQYKDSELRR